MNRFLYLLLTIFLTAPIVAQNVIDGEESEEQTVVQQKRSRKKEPQQNPAVTKTTYNGFSGGMMVHLGYQAGRGTGFPTMVGDHAEETFLRSITYGIGGMARVHLLNHMHVGMEGYVSTMPLKSQGDGSNIRTGWGGALCDYFFTMGRCQFIAGGTLGGGAQRNLHVFNEENSTLIGENFRDTWDNFLTFASQQSTSPATYTKKSFFVFDPYVAIEYAVTNRIHMIFKLDYMLASHSRIFLTPSGPRLYVGFIFGH